MRTITLCLVALVSLTCSAQFNQKLSKNEMRFLTQKAFASAGPGLEFQRFLVRTSTSSGPTSPIRLDRQKIDVYSSQRFTDYSNYKPVGDYSGFLWLGYMLLSKDPLVMPNNPGGGPMIR